MQLIINWLKPYSTQNFIVGRALYKLFGKDPELKTLFAKGDKAPGAKEALLQALQALAAEVPAPAADTLAAQEPADSQESCAPPPVDPPAPAAAPELPASPDPILKALQLEWKSKYKAMQYLRLQLERYGKENALEVQAECRHLCTQILALEQEIMQVWQKVDQYKATGKLEEIKEAPLEVPADPLELAKKISSVQRYIRRHKSNATKFPSNAKYPALILKYEEQLQALTTPKQTQDGAAEKTTL